MAVGTGISQREHDSLVDAMKDMGKEFKKGLENVNATILTMSERITKLETKESNSIPNKIILSLLFTAIGVIITLLFKT